FGASVILLTSRLEKTNAASAADIYYRRTREAQGAQGCVRARRRRREGHRDRGGRAHRVQQVAA
ncbi:MAG: hypothetical protein ACREMQ_19100, partial [Longimicrobiales bacterium]